MKFRPQALTPDKSARHFFGAELRRHRETAQLSLVQVATIVASSKSTLARVETAELMPPPDLPGKLDLALGTDDFFNRLYGLARREIHPDQYRRFMDFEIRATKIENYVAHVVPGPAQTEAYARALLRCQEDLTEEQVEERVTARMSRKDRQRSDSPPYRWALLDESVLRRRVGSPQCMHEQLALLLNQVDTPHSKVQVMPFSAGPHALLGGSLTVLTLPNGSAVAYEEGIEAGHLYEDLEAVERRRRQYEVLRANALSLAESTELIRKAMEDCRPCETPPI